MGERGTFSISLNCDLPLAGFAEKRDGKTNGRMNAGMNRTIENEKESERDFITSHDKDKRGREGREKIRKTEKEYE